MSDPTWISTEHHSTHSDLNPATNIERMLSPQNTHKEDDGKSRDFLVHALFHLRSLSFILFSFLPQSRFHSLCQLYLSLIEIKKKPLCPLWGRKNL